MLLILSDIHIGRHKTDWRKALKLMQDPKWDKIIICGDAIDVWYKSEAIMALLALAIFTNLFDKLIYITGNHDEDVLDILSDCAPGLTVVPFYWETINNKVFAFMHGHRADFFNSKIPWFGKFLTKVHAWFYRIFKWDIQHTVRGKIGEWYLNLQRNWLMKKYDEADILISGHTHDPGRWYSNHMIHYNAGDWVHNNTYIVIDDKGKIELRRHDSDSKSEYTILALG